jgi:hypothetical protein
MKRADMLNDVAPTAPARALRPVRRPTAPNRPIRARRRARRRRSRRAHLLGLSAYLIWALPVKEQPIAIYAGLAPLLSLFILGYAQAGLYPGFGLGPSKRCAASPTSPDSVSSCSRRFRSP